MSKHIRPRLEYGSLMILVCALDSYLDELNEEIKELERANDEEQHRMFLIGLQATRKLKFQFMRYLVGDRGRPPEFWRDQGLKLALKEHELETRFRRMLEKEP